MRQIKKKKIRPCKTNLKPEKDLCERLHSDQIWGHDHCRGVMSAVMICWSLTCEETKTCSTFLSIESRANRSSTRVSYSPLGSSQSLNLFLYWISLSSVWAPMGLDKFRNVFGLLRSSSCGKISRYLSRKKALIAKEKTLNWYKFQEQNVNILTSVDRRSECFVLQDISQRQICTSESKSARIHGKTGYCIRSLYDLPASVLRCIRYWKLLISPLWK